MTFFIMVCRLLELLLGLVCIPFFEAKAASGSIVGASEVLGT